MVPSDVVAHFIREAKHIFLMDGCICREAAGCESFDHGIGCIFLREAVLEINPKRGGWWTPIRPWRTLNGRGRPAWCT